MSGKKQLPTLVAVEPESPLARVLSNKIPPHIDDLRVLVVFFGTFFRLEEDSLNLLHTKAQRLIDLTRYYPPIEYLRGGWALYDQAPEKNQLATQEKWRQAALNQSLPPVEPVHLADLFPVFCISEEKLTFFGEEKAIVKPIFLLLFLFEYCREQEKTVKVLRSALAMDLPPLPPGRKAPPDAESAAESQVEWEFFKKFPEE